VLDREPQKAGKSDSRIMRAPRWLPKKWTVVLFLLISLLGFLLLAGHALVTDHPESRM